MTTHYINMQLTPISSGRLQEAQQHGTPLFLHCLLGLLLRLHLFRGGRPLAIATLLSHQLGHAPLTNSLELCVVSLHVNAGPLA
jgi:hypothetical protein